ncbi:histidine kinase dimerization/phospho-acceptor domain-containing protein, partial [Salmonella enterica]|uniref:histidine kinase dimerization/phospho-acceptor domain-containing protein n=1 Tax=Salmonella enterica TaxID=28901 RepID=UPI00398C6B55
TGDKQAPFALYSVRREIESAIAAVKQRVTRLDTTLDNERLLTAAVAHELRTPLSGVRLHLELLSTTHNVDVAPLIARLDQIMDSVSQLLQLARRGPAFASGTYPEVKLRQHLIPPSYESLQPLAEKLRPH